MTLAHHFGPNTAEPVRPMSKADEKRLARELSPPIAWPTLALAVVLPASYIAVATLGLLGDWPLWACTPVLALLSYAHYTLVHEAVHGNVVSSPKSLAWINTVVGWIGAIGLGMGWPILQRTHLLHHSHTNTDKDPDIFVKGSLIQLLGKWARNLPLSLVPISLAKHLSKGRYAKLQGVFTPADLFWASLVTYANLGLLVAAIATGYVFDWLFLLFLPQRLGSLILNVFFQWLPHHPFDRTDRYGNTRISLWFAGTPLTFQQNLHLMHHLWPSVPFYNYLRLFRALRPVLVAEGSRIEGLGVGTWARRVSPAE